MQNTIQEIQDLFPRIMINEVIIPDEHTLNDMWINYGFEGINKLFNERLNHNESSVQIEQESTLNQVYEGKLEFITPLGSYFILGNLSTELSNMKVSIRFDEFYSKRKHINKVDLYDRTQLMNLAKSISEVEHIDINLLEADLLKLTDLLESYREELFELASPELVKSKNKNLLPPEKQREAIQFLSESNLINRIDELIESSGVVGEESNRKMIFIIASTYKMLHPLHGLVQGTSGSGKSHLINSIANLMPQEDILNMTRVTSKSFYHYQDDDLINKLILIQDFDGLDSEAQFAFREMQSAGFVSSSTTYKDKYGKLVSTVKRVNANFASLVATTHAEIYYDNMSRSIVVGVDESAKQTLSIIEYQNKKTAGHIDERKIIQSKELLQNCIRILKPFQVVNQYADKLQLPVEAKMLRRLNTHYQSFVNQITLLHQFQREKDDQGRLVATIEDLELACEILFDAIMWKIDELDSSLRQFFDLLKLYIIKQPQGKQQSFSTREIRQTFNLSKTQAFRYIDELKSLEYIHVISGSSNKGYRYQVAYWDDMEKTRQRVKEGLMNQIQALK